MCRWTPMNCSGLGLIHLHMLGSSSAASALGVAYSLHFQLNMMREGRAGVNLVTVKEHCTKTEGSSRLTTCIR